jgi:transposase-like protein
MIQTLESLVEMLKVFPDEQSCIDHLTSVRWRDGAFCPYCGGRTVYHFKDGRNHKCGDCRKRFSVKVGTIFEDTKIPLHKWYIAIYLLTSHKKGISSVQLGKDIGVTQKTAWFMNHRLREAARTKSFNAPLKNTVEVDETYVGGKERNKHANKRTPGTQGRNTLTKSAALALVERGGDVRAFHVQDVKSQTLQRFVVQHVALGAQVMTDENRSYNGLAVFYKHRTVNHSSGIYVMGNVHSNTVEGFFSLFKRSIIGIYHHVSAKHLWRYLNESSLRYNLRAEPNGEGFASLLSNCGGRLTYKALIAHEAE